MASTSVQTPPPDSAAAIVHDSGRTAAERAKHHQGPAKKAPKPHGLPVVGNLFDVAKQGMLDFLMEQTRVHGDVFRVKVGSQNMFVVSHPDGVERVLASNRLNYVKGKAYDTLRELLGDGLITLEGDEWRARRRLEQPSFHRKNVAMLSEAMIRLTAQYLEGLKKRFPEGGTMEAHREMTDLTLDVVVEALFGRGLSDKANVSYESLGAALELVSDRANGVSVPRFIPTPSNVKLNRTLDELNRAFHDIVKAARERIESGDDDGSTLLSMLLASRDADTGEPLTDEELRSEVLTLFIAGHETTALTMTWAFVLLDTAPEVIEKMRTEVDTVLEGRTPTFEDVGRLPYIRQVVDEVLRLRPPAWTVARNAVADDNICGFEVKAGDMVMPFFYATHRHPDFWNDVERFDPERFNPEHVKGRDPWSYVPFSGGPRVCIGNTFSLVESTIILAMLAQRLDFKLEPGQEHRPVVVATLRPSAPVNVRFSWR